jgi:hypothetical protein
VIGAPLTVGVEILLLDSMLKKIAAGRRFLGPLDHKIRWPVLIMGNSPLSCVDNGTTWGNI